MSKRYGQRNLMSYSNHRRKTLHLLSAGENLHLLFAADSLMSLKHVNRALLQAVGQLTFDSKSHNCIDFLILQQEW